MKLNRYKAYRLLMEAKAVSDGGYINHSLKVGEAAYRIAKDLELDADKARAMGFIHDIGKRYYKPFNQHVAKGYEYILGLGYDEEYANVCLTHSYLNNDINCTGAGIVSPTSYKYEFRKKFIENHEYTIYDKILNFCDLMCTSEFLIMEERLIDIMIRRGVHTNTQYHLTEALKLKKEIDKKIGKNVYSLFPEISQRMKTEKVKTIVYK
jgi:putative nucleotidyltransferase with HDIG domain